MNLFLVRHGESVGNVEGKIQGWMDFSLSDRGRKQAVAVADRFADVPLNAIYSSDLIRASHTAREIARKKGLEVKEWSSVREVYLGPFQGLTREEIYEKYPETKKNSILTSGVKETETNEQLTARCKEVVDHLLKNHKNEHVAIVSHGGFISIFLMYLLTGDKWHTFSRPFQIGNTSVSHIEWKEEKLLIHYINDTTHLQLPSNVSEQKSLL